MPEMFLTPQGHLHCRPDDGAGADPAGPAGAFERDWREGLFLLAARKDGGPEDPATRYWRQWGQRYLVALCHTPASLEGSAVPPPDEAALVTAALSAPPMRGGEYLSASVLRGIWDALDEWVQAQVQRDGGLEAFLRERAPQWRQVGRVCFHLAENKADPDRPFAFMATFSTGFGAGGRLKHMPLHQALDQYAGARNRPALLKLLEPVHQAGKRCGWVQAMVDDRTIYRPMAWPAARAYRLLRDVPELEEAGLSIRLPNWWRKRPRPRVAVTIGDRKKSKLGAGAMLDFDLSVALGDQTLSPEEIASLLAGEDGLVLFHGQWVEVDRAKLQEALEHWKAVRQRAADGEISFIEGMRLLAGAPADLTDDGLPEEERPWAHVQAGDAMRELLEALRKPGRLDAVSPGRGLRAELRPYQQEGVAWLHFLATLGLGACLADDMGLGKTVQVLAALLCLSDDPARPDRKPSLLVVPASLLGNWRREAERFAPSLKLLFLHPAEAGPKALKETAQDPDKTLKGIDLAVTTYSMLTRQPWLAERRWSLVILDEAQAIKTPGTRQAKAVKALDADGRIVLTGTPIENRVGDLWSIFDFLNPGLLGSAGVFKSFVKSLQNRTQDQYGPLRNLIGPYILRRLKTDKAIIADLPEKTETPCYCGLSKAQARLYQGVVQSLERTLETADGIARRGAVLAAMMRLKQICNHPSQLTGDGQYDPAESGKFQRLAELCEELASRQDKVLIFTQFRQIIDPLSEHLAGVFGREGLTLHGQTAVGKRKRLVEQFQSDDGPPFFILSLKAGGTGLNLTAATHVIHFDRWWNPAVENQATDRAFRIGQRRNVQVHKFITAGTVEERVDALLAEKRQVAEEILAPGQELNVTELSSEEVLSLVRLDVSRAGI